MIKLIAADVDLTMVGEGSHEMNPEYYDVIRALRAKGVFFCAASGRNAMSIFRLFEPVKEEISVISCSGTVYWKAGKPHVISALDYDDVMEIEKDILKIPGSGFAVETASHLYMRPGNQFLYDFLGTSYRNDVTLVESGVFPDDDPFVKVEFYHEKIDQVTEDFMRKWGSRYHQCYAGTCWLDTIAKGCNKGKALALLQADLGISPAETMAFGDNGNDLELLSMAGESFAVANAREEVKAAAKHVIGSWEEDAVLQEMKRLLRSL